MRPRPEGILWTEREANNNGICPPGMSGLDAAPQPRYIDFNWGLRIESGVYFSSGTKAAMAVDGRSLLRGRFPPLLGFLGFLRLLPGLRGEREREESFVSTRIKARTTTGGTKRGERGYSAP